MTKRDTTPAEPPQRTVSVFDSVGVPSAMLALWLVVVAAWSPPVIVIDDVDCGDEDVRPFCECECVIVSW